MGEVSIGYIQRNAEAVMAKEISLKDLPSEVHDEVKQMITAMVQPKKEEKGISKKKGKK